MKLTFDGTHLEGNYWNYRRSPKSARHREPTITTHLAMQAGVCPFSLTSRITQRDSTTGRDAPGSRTLLYPGHPGPAPADSTATFTGVRPLAGTRPTR
jgi:hypothetical protein